MTTVQALRLLRRHGWVLALCGLLGALLGWGFAQTRAPVFTASASGFVGSTKGATSASEASVIDAAAQSRAPSYVDIATSRRVAEQAADRLGLTTPPDALIGRVTVTQPQATVVLRIAATGARPEEARALADAWVAALAAEVAEIEDPTDAGGGLEIIPLEAAALPRAPTSPNVPRLTLLGAALGLVLGAVLAYLRHQLDRRLREPEEIQRQQGLPVVGTIPRSSAMARRAGQDVALVTAGERGDRRAGEQERIAAEAFYRLRTNLQYMDVDRPPRSIVVTSPLPGDGKSTVAANLALALASPSQPVVLIDADLRRPVVAESLGLNEGVGVTDLLVGRASLPEVAQRLPGHPSLTVIAAGKLPPNPAEVVGSQAMRDLIDGLSRELLVVIDSPPLIPVTDAAVLAANSDGALVVVSAGKTLDTQLATALNHLAAVQGRALGIILNKTTRRTGGYYGAEYAAYDQLSRPQAPSSKRASRRVATARR